MANITLPNTFSPNTVARASEVNANFAAITAQVNGNIETVNLAAGAVTTAKIADTAVTEAKLDFDPLIYGEAPSVGSPTPSSVSVSPSSSTLMPAGILTVYAGWVAGSVGDLVFEVDVGAWIEAPYGTATAGGFIRKYAQVISDGTNVRARRTGSGGPTSVSVIKHTLTA